MSLPFHLVLGRSDFASVALSLFSLFLLGFIPFVAFFRSFFYDHPVAAASGYFAYLTCLLASPLILVFSVMVMYEIPGAAISLIAVVAYWNALDARFNELPARAERLYRVAALAALAILLLKWNYGLQFLLLILATESLVAPRTYLKWLGSTFGKVLIDPKVLPVLNVLAALSFLIIAFIAVTGGGVYRVLGASLSITRPENPLYVFVFSAFAKFVVTLYRKRAELGKLRPYHRALLYLTILPYGAWLLYPIPNRFHALLYHLAYKSPGYPPRLSWANFIYYYREFLTNYSFTPTLFWSLLFLFVVFVAYCRRAGQWGSRMAAVFVFFGWLSATYFTDNKEARFLCNTVPSFYFVAAMAIARTTVRWRFAAIAGLLPLALLVPQWTRARALYFDRMTIRPAAYGSEKVVETLRREVIQRLDGDRRLTTAGISDLSYLAPLFELELHRAFPKFSTWPMPKVADYGYRRTAIQHVETMAKNGGLRWVVVFDRTDRPRNADVQAVVDFVLSQPRHEKKATFKLADVGYEGALYRID